MRPRVGITDSPSGATWPSGFEDDFARNHTHAWVPQIPPTKKPTQEDQDKADDQARKKAEQQLEKSWMDRLQLISVITTFFAATEAQLLSITTPNQAILSFTAAFVLIRFRLQEAKEDKHKDSDSEKQTVWSRDPHVALQRVLYRQHEPPLHLLQRFHSLCIYICVVGFVMAAVGILCYVWAMQATSVGIFSSVCLAVCIIAGLVVLCMSPQDVK
ncbi:hypothetical protein K439DRAFT_1150622 [Ramaria rubella]|nr:hypothetical protein K439DRAFT_1150622 [Ramaria rubella]